MKKETENLDLRETPKNLEAEQALLGALLANNRALEKVADFLRPYHFASPAHTKIYEACQSLIERGHVADPVTLQGYFIETALPPCPACHRQGSISSQL